MKSQTKLVAVPVLWVQSACKNHKKRMGITWHTWFPFYTTTIHFDSEVVGNQNHLKKEHTVPVEDKPARWYRDFFIQRSQKDKVWHCFSIMFTEHVLPISQNDATVPFHSPTTTKEKGCQAHQHLKWCWKTMETLSYIYLLLSYGIHNMQLRKDTIRRSKTKRQQQFHHRRNSQSHWSPGEYPSRKLGSTSPSARPGSCAAAGTRGYRMRCHPCGRKMQ